MRVHRSWPLRSLASAFATAFAANAESRLEREKLYAWMREHDVPVEGPGSASDC